MSASIPIAVSKVADKEKIEPESKEPTTIPKPSTDPPLPIEPSEPSGSTTQPSLQDINALEEAVHSIALSELSLSQKLVRALCLVQLGLHRGLQEQVYVDGALGGNSAAAIGLHSTLRKTISASALDEWFANPNLLLSSSSDSLPSSKAPSTSFPAAATLPGFSTLDYSILIEVLASALRDASSAPWLWGGSGAIPSLGEMKPSPLLDPISFTSNGMFGLGPLHESMDDGCEMAMAARAAEATTAPAMEPAPTLPLDASEKESGDEAPSSIVVRDLPVLLFDNLKDLVSLLKPTESAPSNPLLASPVQSKGTLLLPFAAPSGALASPQLSSEDDKDPLDKTNAHAAILSLPDETLAKILIMARFAKDDTSCECEQSCPTSRTAAQRWALSLARTCQRFKTPAQRAAYNQVRLRRRNQVTILLTLIKDKAELGEFVRELDIKVPGLSVAANGGANAAHPYLTHPRHGSRRAAAFPWLAPVQAKCANHLEADDEVEQLANLVKACTSLHKLELNIARPSFAYAGWSYGAEFMEPGLERALSMSPVLKSLSLRQCLDFGELEAVLLSCTTLEYLRLENGVDNLDGLDDVIARPHEARLKEFFLNSWENSDLGEAQLVWILRPAVGTLERLEVATSVGLTTAGLNGGNLFPPFGGADFADLLVELAPTLIRLALKDSLGQGPGLGQVNPSLRNPPHDGALDYALTNADNLREVALEWAFTGPRFLDIIADKPITILALLGAPVVTTAAAFAAKLDSGSDFESLERLALAHFPLHQQGPGWSARDVRTLRRACHDRRLQFEFSTI